MRRDQVLKICLNHALTANIDYTKKEDKAWFFVAPDFSEGEVSYDNFCLRFKTAEIADEFKVAVDKALGVKAEQGEFNFVGKGDVHYSLVLFALCAASEKLNKRFFLQELKRKMTQTSSSYPRPR